MAIIKFGSRATERVRIRKLHAAGFSVSQITGKMAIHPDHVQQVIDAQEKPKEAPMAKRHREADEKADRIKKALNVPENPPEEGEPEKKRRRSRAAADA